MAPQAKCFPCEKLFKYTEKYKAECRSISQASRPGAAVNNKETLFQVRWSARSNTRGCLSSTCVLWLAHFCIHTCTHTRLRKIVFKSNAFLLLGTLV